VSGHEGSLPATKETFRTRPQAYFRPDSGKAKKKTNPRLCNRNNWFCSTEHAGHVARGHRGRRPV
jgi:hypothetical protein